MDRRGSAASRGYGHAWRKARLEFLALEPLCRHCATEGLATPAEVVDHIEPHEGDEIRFWDRANWQPLCKRHHDIKTAAEDGGFGRSAVNWHPPFLKPAGVPLTIVCGAPLSGKSSFVEANRAPSDRVIDLDQIGAELCGCGPYDWPSSRLNEVGRERNRRLAELARCEGEPAWFVVGEPDPIRRAWWATILQPDRIIVLETPRLDCLKRLELTDRGGRDVAGVIDGWWRTYRRRKGDWILRPGDAEPWAWPSSPAAGAAGVGAG